MRTLRARKDAMATVDHAATIAGHVAMTADHAVTTDAMTAGRANLVSHVRTARQLKNNNFIIKGKTRFERGGFFIGRD